MSVITKFKSGESATHGISATTGVDYGIILKFNRTEKQDENKLEDEHGELVGVAMFNQSKDFDVEVAIKVGGSLPAVGDAITIDGVTNCIVSEVGKPQEQKGWQKANIKASKGPYDLV